MITVVYIVLVLVSLLCMYFGGILFLLRRTEEFQSEVKTGDFCYIYQGNERMKSVITDISDHNITVEDEEGWPHKLPRCEIYPISLHVR